MKSDERQPPALAVWLMRHVGNEIVTGDLLERFSEGESKGWFWHQVLMAILVGGSRECRAHWPQLCFSAVGAPLLWFCAGPFIGAVLGSPAGARAWTWGLQLDGLMAMAYDLAFRSLLVAVMIQPLLAVMLILDGAFRWIKLLRTMLISLPLIGVTALIWELWSERLSSPLFFVPLMLATLLVSAWMGCRTDSETTLPDDSVLLASKAVISGVVGMYLLYEASSTGAAKVLLLAVACGWIAGRLNRQHYRTMLVVMAMSWLLLFGPEVFYWWKILSDSALHPWFRTYLFDWFRTQWLYGAKFGLAIAGILAGGWLSTRNGLRVSGGGPPVRSHR